jgi:hypothetical protein
MDIKIFMKTSISTWKSGTDLAFNHLLLQVIAIKQTIGDHVMSNNNLTPDKENYKNPVRTPKGDTPDRQNETPKQGDNDEFRYKVRHDIDDVEAEDVPGEDTSIDSPPKRVPQKTNR